MSLSMRSFTYVTTCVVVWIEILYVDSQGRLFNVTTCVVVWIEIIRFVMPLASLLVTTCVVVWIEICCPASV